MITMASMRGRKILAVVQNLTAVGLKKANKAFGEDTFAAATCANDQVAHARPHGHIHTVDDGFIAKAFP